MYRYFDAGILNRQNHRTCSPSDCISKILILLSDSERSWMRLATGLGDSSCLTAWWFSPLAAKVTMILKHQFSSVCNNSVNVTVAISEFNVFEYVLFWKYLNHTFTKCGPMNVPSWQGTSMQHGRGGGCTCGDLGLRSSQLEASMQPERHSWTSSIHDHWRES